MKYNETIASKCRYGAIAAHLFTSAEIIAEEAEDGYQGFASVVGKLLDGTFIHYEWNYGSCSGCDDWEYRGLSDEQILEEMKRDSIRFPNVYVLSRYFHINSLYDLCNDTDFKNLAIKVKNWLIKN